MRACLLCTASHSAWDAKGTTKSDYIYGFTFLFCEKKRDECNKNEIQMRRNSEYTLFAIELHISSLANNSRSTSKLLYQSLALAEVEESIKIDTQVHNTFFCAQSYTRMKRKKKNIIMLWFYRFLWFCFTFCYCNRWNVLAHFSIKISINFIIIISGCCVQMDACIWIYNMYINGAQPFHVHQSSHTCMRDKDKRRKIAIGVFVGWRTQMAYFEALNLNECTMPKWFVRLK